MKQPRDMTRPQFVAACERAGFKSDGPMAFMGYYRLPIPGRHHSVSVFNAGERRRDQLAYLHARLKEALLEEARACSNPRAHNLNGCDCIKSA